MTDAATIQCDIDRSHAHLAAPLLRSFVHHQCIVVDCDVATVDALDAAAVDLIDEVTKTDGRVTRIELVPDARAVDIRLSVDGGGGSTRPPLRLLHRLQDEDRR